MIDDSTDSVDGTKRPTPSARRRSSQSPDCSESQAIRVAAIEIDIAYARHRELAAKTLGQSTVPTARYEQATKALYESLRTYDTGTREQRARLQGHFQRLLCHTRIGPHVRALENLERRLHESLHPWPEDSCMLSGWCDEVRDTIAAAYAHVRPEGVPVLQFGSLPQVIGVRLVPGTKLREPPRVAEATQLGNSVGTARRRRRRKSARKPVVIDPVRYETLDVLAARWLDGWTPAAEIGLEGPRGERCSAVLRVLLSSTSPITVTALAKKCGWNRRTTTNAVNLAKNLLLVVERVLHRGVELTARGRAAARYLEAASRT